MITITKQEREVIRKAYPRCTVPRTKNGNYHLVEETHILRCIRHINAEADSILRDRDIDEDREGSK